jgi:hypothetical protein
MSDRVLPPHFQDLVERQPHKLNNGLWIDGEHSRSDLAEGVVSEVGCEAFLQP